MAYMWGAVRWVYQWKRGWKRSW